MDENRLPTVLVALGRDLRAAAQRDIDIERAVAARERGRRWPRRRRNALFFAVGALACAGAGAGASGLFDGGDTATVSREPSSQVGQPAADPGVVPSSAVPDPGGGLPWAVKVFTSAGGEDCVRIGRLRDSVLGQVVNGTFRALPTDATGAACADLERTPLLVSGQVLLGGDTRTVVYGIARDRRPVTVTLGGASTVVRPRGQGTFVVVRKGTVRPISVRTTDASGDIVRQTIPL